MILIAFYPEPKLYLCLLFTVSKLVKCISENKGLKQQQTGEPMEKTIISIFVPIENNFVKLTPSLFPFLLRILQLFTLHKSIQQIQLMSKKCEQEDEI